MEASTQYNDFKGTAAADISDHTNLNEFLKSRGVDTERYDAIGANFYHGYADSFYASIVCVDKERSSEDKPYLTNISFEDEFSHEDFFDLFKRFDVVITMKHGGYQDHKIDEEITFDDRGES